MKKAKELYLCYHIPLMDLNQTEEQVVLILQLFRKEGAVRSGLPTIQINPHTYFISKMNQQLRNSMAFFSPICFV